MKILSFYPFLSLFSFCFGLFASAHAHQAVKAFVLQVPELEITPWAESPLFFNPTNMDVDRNGRIWVTEGVNYRRSQTRKEGDRVVVLEDTDLDGVADKSTVFVQDPYLVAPILPRHLRLILTQPKFWLSVKQLR